ncbi:MAG: haloacid dehalogenase type II [Gaiellaceae bacterium]
MLFDVVGTLFDVTRLGDVLTAQGAPAGMLEAWFERLLHTASSLTLAGEWAPFSDLVRPTLETTAARIGVEIDSEHVLRALQELPLHEPARRGIERLAGAGVPIAALTNASAASAQGLLERAGVLDLFTAVLSVEAVSRYKPDPAPYLYALERFEVPAERAAFVAAHAWDVLGASSVGMRAVWVAAHERSWPLPVPAGEVAFDVATAVELLLGGE